MRAEELIRELIEMYTLNCSDNDVISAVISTVEQIKDVTRLAEGKYLAPHYTVGDIRAVGDFHGSLKLMTEFVESFEDYTYISLARGLGFDPEEVSGLDEFKPFRDVVKAQRERVIPQLMTHLKEKFGEAKVVDESKVDLIFEKYKLLAMPTSETKH